MKIKITNCDSGKTYTPRPSTINSVIRASREDYDAPSPFDALISLALEKWYGKNKFFWRDRGLADAGIFGQVCEPLPQRYGGGNNCITGRIRIDMTVNGHDVCNGYDFWEALEEE